MVSVQIEIPDVIPRTPAGSFPQFAEYGGEFVTQLHPVDGHRVELYRIPEAKGDYRRNARRFVESALGVLRRFADLRGTVRVLVDDDEVHCDFLD